MAQVVNARILPPDAGADALPERLEVGKAGAGFVCCVQVIASDSRFADDLVMSEASWTDLCVECGEMTMLRQGDILLVQIDDLPSGTDKVPERRGSQLEYVLAHGEATGHAHSVLADYRVVVTRSVACSSSCKAGAELRHEEHRPLPLPPGNYRIVRQRTYDVG